MHLSIGHWFEAQKWGSRIEMEIPLQWHGIDVGVEKDSLARSEFFDNGGSLVGPKASDSVAVGSGRIDNGGLAVSLFFSLLNTFGVKMILYGSFFQSICQNDVLSVCVARRFVRIICKHEGKQALCWYLQSIDAVSM